VNTMARRLRNPVLTAYVEGIGLLGPGLSDWPQARAVFAGDAAYVPAAAVLPSASSLPPAERRRVGRAVKLALAVGREAIAAAGLDATTLPTVFTSSGADGYNCHEICAVLASDDRQISPTRFHNSVHNAPAGYWSIATGAMTPAAVLSAFDASFGAGLLEAMAQVSVDAPRCVLIAYDTDYPEPLRSVRPIPDAFGMALVLAAAPTERAVARIDVSIVHEPSDQLTDAAFESLRRDYPAARALPLLQAIAGGVNRRVVLDYLDDCALAVEVSSCN
jgi:hypothetical protein